MHWYRPVAIACRQHCQAAALPRKICGKSGAGANIGRARSLILANVALMFRASASGEGKHHDLANFPSASRKRRINILRYKGYFLKSRTHVCHECAESCRQTLFPWRECRDLRRRGRLCRRRARRPALLVNGETRTARRYAMPSAPGRVTPVRTGSRAISLPAFSAAIQIS